MSRNVDQVSGEVVDAAVRIHRGLGPGLLESVYESVLARDLERRGLAVERQKYVTFEFHGMRFDDGLRIDMLVEGQVLVELKSQEHLAPVHFRQVVTYLRLMDLRVGLLLNFGEATMKAGLHRIVNRYTPPRLRASA